MTNEQLVDIHKLLDESDKKVKLQWDEEVWQQTLKNLENHKCPTSK